MTTTATPGEELYKELDTATKQFIQGSQVADMSMMEDAEETLLQIILQLKNMFDETLRINRTELVGGGRRKRKSSKKRKTKKTKRGNRRRGSKKRSKSSRKRSKRANNKRRNNNRTKRRRGVNHRGGGSIIETLAVQGRRMLNNHGPESDPKGMGWVGREWLAYNSHAANIIDDIEILLESGVGEDELDVRVLMKDFGDLGDEIRHYSEATSPNAGRWDQNTAMSYIRTLGNVALIAGQGTPEVPVKRSWMLDTESRPKDPDRLRLWVEAAEEAIAEEAESDDEGL